MSMLNSPLQVGTLTLKNRLVMPPMATSKTADGKINDDLINYYKAKTADQAIGLVIVEHSYVSLEGKASSHQTSIADDATIPPLKQLTEVIHANETKTFAQINHAGAAAKQEIINMQPLGPSAIALPRKDAATPKEMNLDDINKCIEDFQKAALRAKKAGFDGVEIHSAHGYLLNEFYSPLTNRRSDEFGGNLTNRIHLHLMIIKAIRQVVGDDYPLALRLGACDFMENGSTLQDAIDACQAFEKAGINLLDISGGLNGYIRPGHNEQGYFQDITEAIKNNVHIPVLLTGGITDALAAEAILVEHKADLIGVGRAILKDDHWAKNAMELCQ